jgi:hypothetical protein
MSLISRSEIGSPAKWSPPVKHPKLNPDSGLRFVDQNAARYEEYPMEPAIRSVLQMKPEYDFGSLDIVTCRSTLNNLLRALSRRPDSDLIEKPFEFGVEIIGDVVLFIRKEFHNTELVQGFKGYGRNFPGAYTSWEKETRKSTSHHRVAEFNLIGLKYLIRYESDGYLPDKILAEPDSSKPDEKTTNKGSISASIDELASDDIFSTMNITSEEETASSRGKLKILAGGKLVSQSATMDIKTRAGHREVEIDQHMQTFWLSQTPSLITAYHSYGVFSRIEILDVTERVRIWEARNKQLLRQLDGLVRAIRDIVRETLSQKCHVRYTGEGVIEIYEHNVEYPSVLPEELCEKLRDDNE